MVRTLISFLFIIITFSTIHAQQNVEKEPEGASIEKTKDSIPKSLQECINRLDAIWDKSIKEKIKNSSIRSISENAFYGFGSWMIEKWNLWDQTPLNDHYVENLVRHPVDVASVILFCYHKHLNDEDFDPENHGEIEEEWKETFVFTKTFKIGKLGSSFETNDQGYLFRLQNTVLLLDNNHKFVKDFGVTDIELLDRDDKPYWLKANYKDSAVLFDTKGNKITDLIGDESILNFNGGPAIELKREKEICLLDRQGRVIVPYDKQYVRAMFPAEKRKDFLLIVAKDKLQTMYINGDSILSGEKLGMLRRSRIAPSKTWQEDEPREILVYKTDGKLKFYHFENKTISEYAYEVIIEEQYGKYVAKRNGKFGLMDALENVKIPFEYDEMITSFNSVVVRKDSLYAVLDFEGNVELPLKYQLIRKISKDRLTGLYRAPIVYQDKRGYYDENYEIVIPFQYESVYGFTQGLAGVKIDGKWGFIDINGKLVIEPQFDKIYSFSNGKEATVYKGDKKMRINRKGECVEGCE